MRGFALTSVGAPAGPPAQGEERGPTQSRGQGPSLARSLLLWGAGVTVTSGPQQAGPVQLPSLSAGGVIDARSTSHPQGSGESKKKRRLKPEQAIVDRKPESQPVPVAGACAANRPSGWVLMQPPKQQRRAKQHPHTGITAPLDDADAAPPIKRKRRQRREIKTPVERQKVRIGLAQLKPSSECPPDKGAIKKLEARIREWESIVGDAVEGSVSRSGPDPSAKSSDTTAQLYWWYKRGAAPESDSDTDTANFSRYLDLACIAAGDYKALLAEGRKQSNEVIRRAWEWKEGDSPLLSKDFEKDNFKSFRSWLDFLEEHVEAGLWRPSPMTCEMLEKFEQASGRAKEKSLATEYLANFEELLNKAKKDEDDKAKKDKDDKAKKDKDDKPMQDLQKALDDIYCLRWTTFVEKQKENTLKKFFVGNENTPSRRRRIVLGLDKMRRVTHDICIGNKALWLYLLLAFSGRPERTRMKQSEARKRALYSAKAPRSPPPTPDDFEATLQMSYKMIRKLLLGGKILALNERPLRDNADTRLNFLEHCVQAGTWTGSPPISLLIIRLSAAASEDAIDAAKTVYLQQLESARALALGKGEEDTEAMGKFLNMLDDFCCLISAVRSDAGDLVIYRRPSRVEEPAQPLCAQIDRSALLPHLYDIMISDPVLERYLMIAFHNTPEYKRMSAAKVSRKNCAASQTSRKGLFCESAAPRRRVPVLTPLAALTSFAQKLDGVKLTEVEDLLAQEDLLEGLKAIFTGGTLADQHALFAGLLSLKEKALSTKSEAINLMLPQRERFTKEGISTIAANIHIETLKEVLGRLEAEVPWVKDDPLWNTDEIDRINEEAPIDTKTPRSKDARDAIIRKCTDNGEREGALSDGLSTDASEKVLEHVTLPRGSREEYAPSSTDLSDVMQLLQTFWPKDESSLDIAREGIDDVVYEANTVDRVESQELQDERGRWEERVKNQNKSWPWPSPRSSPDHFQFRDVY